MRTTKGLSLIAVLAALVFAACRSGPAPVAPAEGQAPVAGTETIESKWVWLADVRVESHL